MKKLGVVFGFLVAVAISLPMFGRLAHRHVLSAGSPHKVFVVLGFHTSFYHSWRGDTPDEAGFGTDIRIVREILRMLDEANAEGLDARGYWEADNHFTLETILPQHAPDILEGIRRRVDAGRDEVLLAPYNNGFFSAMTEDEVRAAVRWAVRNPWGSGAADLFGRYLPVLRPQEAMFTPGLIPILLDEGIEGLILSYSTYPFTTFSNFVPPMSTAQRHGLTWMRNQPDGPRIKLFPCASNGDVVDFVSLEKWMLELRELQLKGEVDHDLVIHLNIDADAETWVPLAMPPGFGWLPNTGGLREYIDAVNKYDWAEFTTPGEFMRDHEPVGEVVVRQDTADGGWDGYYSWSEKLGSQELWTRLEQSRLFEAQARRLSGSAAPDPRAAAANGDRDSSFFHRLRSLSTTHFGMSTPMVNEERFAAGAAAIENARGKALATLRQAAQTRAAQLPPSTHAVLYSFEVHATQDRLVAGVPIRIPVRLPWPIPQLRLVDGDAAVVPFSLVDVEPPADGATDAVLVVVPTHAVSSPWRLDLGAGEVRDAAVAAAQVTDSARLDNGRLALSLSSANGVDSLRLDDTVVGGPEFLSSFITYRTDAAPESQWASDWRLSTREHERLDGIQRQRLATRIPLVTPDGTTAASVQVDFTLPDAAPFVVADVRVDYPYTEKRDVLATPQQKLRMLIDARWIEVAPFQLQPSLTNEDGASLRLWRRNFLDVVDWFDLDYGRINPRNANVDAFNHAVTSAWVAVTDGRRGLLLAPDASVHVSPNFAPMRLREEHGRQRLTINPFGSYHGAPMDYSHLGGSGLATDLAAMVAASMRPNGPSFNGRSQRFSLLLAPYVGDRPPADLEAAARSFYQPPTVLVLRTPEGTSPRLAMDLAEEQAAERRLRQSPPEPAVPRAFLASPTAGAIDLVWDAPAEATGIGYEVAWRPAGQAAWSTLHVGTAHRHRVDGLGDGQVVEARVRAEAAGLRSEWTATATVEVGPVGEQSAVDFFTEIRPSVLARLVQQSLVHVLTVP